MLRILAARNLFRRNKVQVSHASSITLGALLQVWGALATRPLGACSDLFGFFLFGPNKKQKLEKFIEAVLGKAEGEEPGD